MEAWANMCSGPVGTLLSQFANRVLSITANSASCERLFSVFGNTLTKLRNRMGASTLANIAELRMHLRDEELAESKEQCSTRIKRHLGTRNLNDIASGTYPTNAQMPNIRSTAPAHPTLPPRQNDTANTGPDSEDHVETDTDAPTGSTIPAGQGV